MSGQSINIDPLLIVRRMNVAFDGCAGPRIPVIENVSFSVFPSTTLVLLGESGSGKTVLSRSLTGLLNWSARVTGSVLFDGVELLSAGEEALRQVRRRGIRYVFQDPLQALNPLLKVESQLRMAGSDGSRDKLSAVLRTVGIPDEREVLRSYPHQLSVGMAQRVMLAMAMAASPKLLIADEPTSAVDVSLRFRLMDLLLELRRGHGLSLLLITHDLDIARLYGDHVAVLYEGRLVESAPATEFFHDPHHPYSRMLIGLHGPGPAKIVDPGEFPGDENQGNHAARCRFSLRCPVARPRCSEEEPALEDVGSGREVRCFYWK
jgi:oligopeptide/dipeptide ABC transporter ATP-binding protein